METKYSIKREDLNEALFLKAKSEYYIGPKKQSTKRHNRSMVQFKEELPFKLPSISREVSPNKDGFQSTTFSSPIHKQDFGDIFNNSDHRKERKDKKSISAYKKFSQQIEKELATAPTQSSQEMVR